MKQQNSEKDKALREIERLFKEQDARRGMVAHVREGEKEYSAKKQPKKKDPYEYNNAFSVKRIKENDFVRMYGEGSGGFVTIFPSRLKRKWMRNAIDKFRMWKAERTGKNYIFHKRHNKEELQERAFIRNKNPKPTYQTPREITSLENMFKDLAKERETLKDANKVFKKDLEELRKKRLKKRMTIYIPRIKFRPKK